MPDASIDGITLDVTLTRTQPHWQTAMATLRKIVSKEHGYEESEEKFEQAINVILPRCKSASLTVNRDHDLPAYDAEYNILIPQGRGHREINIWNAVVAQRFADISFEDFRFIAGYSAIYSDKDNLIEAAIRPLNMREFRGMKNRLFFVPDEDTDAETGQAILFEQPDGRQKIQIGAPSDAFVAMNAGSSGPGVLTLRLEGYSVKQHDKALGILESTADSVFMQLDLVVGLPFALARDRQNRVFTRRNRGALKAIESMAFPQQEYDRGPVSLYQYGRSAEGMPLLQFLAFYQVAEFYYPTYSDADARRRVRNVLKDPKFRESRETDIGRLLLIIQSKGNKFGSERAQLKATVNECVDAPGLLEFVHADPKRSEYFTEYPRKGRHARINMQSGNDDLLDEVAARLYDIRCEIVHTKDTSDDLGTERARLLPFSAEADQLEHDIALMQFVAQRVLIASSRSV